MKYKVGQVLYFKPTYKEVTKECWICQIVKYIENNKKYLVIVHDIYAPCHYMKGFVKEVDLQMVILQQIKWS